MYSCSTGAHRLSCCFHGEHRAAPLEHVEQLLTMGANTAAPLEHNEQLLPRAQRAVMLERVEQRLSGSRYSCSTGAAASLEQTAALLEHVEQRLSGADTAAPLEHMEQQFPSSTEQLCWSTLSSSSLGADTGAPLEHMKQWLGAQRLTMLERVEQRLSGSRYSCSTGAHGAAASLEHTEQLYWSIWSSGSLGADTVASLEHRAALQEHVEQRLSGSRYSCSTGAHRAAVSLEHREQVCWSTWSSGSLGADTVPSSSTGEHGAAPLW